MASTTKFLVEQPLLLKKLLNLHFIIYGKFNACLIISLNSQRFSLSYLPLVPIAFVQSIDGFKSKTYCPIHVFTLVSNPHFFSLKLLIYILCIRFYWKFEMVERALSHCKNAYLQMNVGYPALKVMLGIIPWRVLKSWHLYRFRYVILLAPFLFSLLSSFPSHISPHF